MSGTIAEILSIAEAGVFGVGGVRDLAQAVRGSVLTHVAYEEADTDLLSTDGLSITTSVYQIDLAAGVVVLSGAVKSVGALNDQDLLADITSYNLAGGAAAAISVDDLDIEIALVVLNISGTATVFGVFGVEAATGTAVKPTGKQCWAAIKAASPANWDGQPGLIIGRILAARAGAAVSFTHEAAATSDALKSERLHGTVF